MQMCEYFMMLSMRLYFGLMYVLWSLLFWSYVCTRISGHVVVAQRDFSGLNQVQQSHMMCRDLTNFGQVFPVVDTHFSYLVKQASSVLAPQDQSCTPINQNEKYEQQQQQQQLQTYVDSH